MAGIGLVRDNRCDGFSEILTSGGQILK